MNNSEITQPLLDCIINSDAKPGKKFGLIKTHKPNNPIRLITSGCRKFVFIYRILFASFRKERATDPYRHHSTFEKVKDIDRRFSPFPAGTLLVSWDVISMYPSIDNEVELGAFKAALDRRDKLSPSTDCLLEAIKITLECNNSTFKVAAEDRSATNRNNFTQLYKNGDISVVITCS